MQFYSLKKDGKQKAFFYLDPYSRPAGVLQCALQGEFCQSIQLMWQAENCGIYRCHMYCGLPSFWQGQAMHRSHSAVGCLQCVGSGKSLRQSIWVGSAGGMQAWCA